MYPVPPDSVWLTTRHRAASLLYVAETHIGTRWNPPVSVSHGSSMQYAHQSSVYKWRLCWANIWMSQHGHTFYILSLCAWPVDSHHKEPIIGALLFHLLLAWTSCLTNNRITSFDTPWCPCDIIVLVLILDVGWSTLFAEASFNFHKWNNNKLCKVRWFCMSQHMFRCKTSVVLVPLYFDTMSIWFYILICNSSFLNV